jgi:hypothetical protein
MATGRSITSTLTVSATVSTTGVTGCLIRRAAFFSAARGLGLALAIVRLVAALAALRALPREADFPFGSFPRFCALLASYF